MWLWRFPIVPSRNVHYSVSPFQITTVLLKGVTKLIFCVCVKTNSPVTWSKICYVFHSVHKQTSRNVWWILDSDAAPIWTDSIWMFSYCVSSCSCEPTCFSHCAPPRDGRTESKVTIGQQRGSERERRAYMRPLYVQTPTPRQEMKTWTVRAYRLSQYI